MSDLRKYLEMEFLRIRKRQDSMQQSVRELLAHQNTGRQFQTTMKEDIAAIRQDLANIQRVPENRTFPVKTKEELDRVCGRLRADNQKAKVEQEIEYVLERAPKDNWLKKLIDDQVVAQFKQAKTLRELNIVQYVIRDITHTSDTVFTAMVSAAKSRLYSAAYRQKGKAKENRPGSSVQPVRGQDLGPPQKKRRVPDKEEEDEDDEDEKIDEEEENDKDEEIDEEEENEEEEDIPSPGYSPVKNIR